jgi:hypothetical protein
MGRVHFHYTITVIPTIRIAGMKGKDMVGQKRAVFPRCHQGQNRCSTLVLATSNGVLRGFLPRIHPVLAPVWRFGVLRELPSPQNRCLHRYGMAETPNCPFLGHTGIPIGEKVQDDLLQQRMVIHAQPAAQFLIRTVGAGGSTRDVLRQKSHAEDPTLCYALRFSPSRYNARGHSRTKRAVFALCRKRQALDQHQV